MTIKQISTHAHVAKLIRAELKKHNIKASVTSECYAGGNSVHIKVQDLAPWIVEKIESYCKQYQYGHFDGMNDIYEYSNCRSNIPQVKFVFVDCDFSDDMKNKAYQHMKSVFPVCFEELPEHYSELSWRVRTTVSDEFARTLVYQVLANRCNLMHSEDHFWKKPRIKCKAA